MSTYLPASSTGLSHGHRAASSWLHHAIDRPRRMLTAWRARRRFRREVSGLSEHLLRDVGLGAVARQENVTPHWSGHTPR